MNLGHAVYGQYFQILTAFSHALQINDLYPKARYHQLCISRDPSLESIYDLQTHHVPLLKHMKEVALAYSLKQSKVCLLANCGLRPSEAKLTAKIEALSGSQSSDALVQ